MSSAQQRVKQQMDKETSQIPRFIQRMTSQMTPLLMAIQMEEASRITLLSVLPASLPRMLLCLLRHL